MRTNNNILFPYYSGNIRLTKVLGHVKINQFIRAHQSTSLANKRLFKKISECEDPKEKRKLKHQLYSFTPSVFINKGRNRCYDNIVGYTQLMQLDFDKINDNQTAKELKDWIFEQPETVCTYFSPSKDVKAIIRIKPVYNKEQYIRVHNSVTEKYEETGYFDVATKNAVLPLFLSTDDQILWRDFSEAKPWMEEKTIEIEHKHLNESPPNFINPSNSYYYNKTVKILSRKINNIVDNGHPQVRSATLILGSRVAAGYINKSDAIRIAEELVKCNNYLSKGTDGYLETVRWAIEEGSKNPRYY